MRTRGYLIDAYGSPEGLADHLDRCIEMLLYLEADAFTAVELRDTVAALRDIATALRRGWTFPEPKKS